ncbi:MAG: cytosine permease, partial [Pseudonocardia sp.]
MGVDPARSPEDQARPVGSGRHRGAEPAGAERADFDSSGFDPSGFERNGVDRIPEGDRTSTPKTFSVIFLGSSVGLGAVAFGWVGMTFGLGLWATISAIAVGTAVGIVLLIPLTLLGSRTATNNATSSGAAFGV